MSIASTNNAGNVNNVNTTPTTNTTASKGMGMTADDFMKVFLSQLEYQNPIEPMDSSAMLSQFSQISSVQSTMELKKTLTELQSAMASLSADSQLTQAQSMLGQKVKYVDGTGAEKDGLVESIRIAPAGAVQLAIAGGAVIDVDTVREVMQA